MLEFLSAISKDYRFRAAYEFALGLLIVVFGEVVVAIAAVLRDNTFDPLHPDTIVPLLLAASARALVVGANKALALVAVKLLRTFGNTP